jgi:hypothetical protein
VDQILAQTARPRSSPQAAARRIPRPGETALGYLLVLRFVLFVPVTIVGFAIFLARYGRSRR